MDRQKSFSTASTFGHVAAALAPTQPILPSQPTLRIFPSLVPDTGNVERVSTYSSPAEEKSARLDGRPLVDANPFSEKRIRKI